MGGVSRVPARRPSSDVAVPPGPFPGVVGPPASVRAVEPFGGVHGLAVGFGELRPAAVRPAVAAAPFGRCRLDSQGRLFHTAAVEALEWCPGVRLVASLGRAWVSLRPAAAGAVAGAVDNRGRVRLSAGLVRYLSAGEVLDEVVVQPSVDVGVLYVYAPEVVEVALVELRRALGERVA